MIGKGGLNKIVVLALALLLAMGAMGTAYGAWVDEIYIDGYFSTSGVNTSLSCGAHSPEVSCGVSDMTLNITVTDAPPGDYYCNFTLDNTATGTLPVKIKTVTIPSVPTGFSVSVPSSLTGYVIDSGATLSDTIGITLTEDYSDSSGSFDVAFNIVRWHE